MAFYNVILQHLQRNLRFTILMKMRKTSVCKETRIIVSLKLRENSHMPLNHKIAHISANWFKRKQ